jgi:hypothetical protein
MADPMSVARALFSSLAFDLLPFAAAAPVFFFAVVASPALPLCVLS